MKKSAPDSLAERLEKLQSNPSSSQPMPPTSDTSPASLKKMRELTGDLKTSMQNEASSPSLPHGARPGSASGARQPSRGTTPTSGARPQSRTRANQPSRGISTTPTAGVATSPLMRMQDKERDVPESFAEVQERARLLERENNELLADMKRRQDSYMRREAQYKQTIDNLKSLLDKATLGRQEAEQGGMYRLRALHSQILEGIGHLQEKTVNTLQDQEKDLLRAFKARLYEVQVELKKERDKKEDGALEWIEKTKNVNKELEWTKEEALRLHRQNQAYKEENARLKQQFKTQEDDREFLVRQLMTLKKDNARLKQELEKRTAERNSMTAAMMDENARRQPGMATGGGRALGGDAEARYKEVIRRLKRLLEVERRNLRAVRTAHVAELQARTELEVFLRQCIDHVKGEIAKRRGAIHTRPGTAASGGFDAPAFSGAPGSTFGVRPGSSAGGRPGTAASRGGERKASDVSLQEMGPADREKVLELLLSQERVINLLYDRTFPPKGRPAGGAIAAAAMLGLDDDPTKSLDAFLASNDDDILLEDELLRASGADALPSPPAGSGHAAASAGRWVDEP
eukprot:tig00020904_g15215.t1